MRIAVPSNAPGGLDATVSPHFGRCEVFTVVEIRDGKIENVSTVENQGSHLGFEPTPAEVLVSRGVDAILAQGMGPKAMQLFAQRGIAVYMTSSKTVRDAINELVENKAKLASLEDACREAKELVQASPPFPPSFAPGMGMGRGMGRGMGLGVGRGVGPYPFAPPSVQYPPAPMPRPSVPTGVFKVGVASQGAGGINDLVAPMFGRCPTFTVLEIDGKKIKNVRTLPNQYFSAPSGVGIAVVQMLANEGVRYILAGRFGPNVSAVAGQLGVQMVMTPPGMKIKDAVEQYLLSIPR